MRRVKWPANTCTVGETCIHGYFTKKDLEKLFEYCPHGTFTPTNYHEHLPVGGYSFRDLNRIDRIGTLSEWGYYFHFEEKSGTSLIEFLRGEGTLWLKEKGVDIIIK